MFQGGETAKTLVSSSVQLKSGPRDQELCRLQTSLNQFEPASFFGLHQPLWSCSSQKTNMFNSDDALKETMNPRLSRLLTRCSPRNPLFPSEPGLRHDPPDTRTPSLSLTHSRVHPLTHKSPNLQRENEDARREATATMTDSESPKKKEKWGEKKSMSRQKTKQQKLFDDSMQLPNQHTFPKQFVCFPSVCVCVWL